MRFQDKLTIVTGAASGFGEGIAHAFAAEGARVAVLDIDSAGAERVAADIGQQAIAVRCDVASLASVREATASVVSSFGGIDVLVNNAGWSHRNQPMLDVDESTFDRVFEINVKSIYNFAQAVLPVMRARGGGSIVNIGSTAGISPRPGLSWYNASKGAVNTLSQAMAAELASEGIRVNCVAPVIGETALLETFMGVPDSPQARERFLATIPLGRMSTPRDVANATLFLASDASDLLTGVILPVDGGRTI